MSTKPYAALRGVMAANDVTPEYLAAKLQLSHSYVKERLRGERPWSLEDTYTIMDIFHLPHNQLHIYFPPNGDASCLNMDSTKPCRRRFSLVEDPDGVIVI